VKLNQCGGPDHAVRSSLVRLLNGVPAPVAGRFKSTGRPARFARPFLNRLLTSEATPITVRSGPAKGIKLLINPRVEKYYWTGTYEPGVQEQLRKLLGAGCTFWDVGAHVGFFTLLASRLVGEGGHVRAFEPVEENRVRLQTALDLNGARNVTVHGCALAADAGERMLYAHEASNMWTLVPERGEDQRVRIECRTLDELTSALGPPDLIKIDVEGAEVDALRGGRELLMRRRPTLIVEFTDDAAQAAGSELLPDYAAERLGDRQWLLSPM
jgi:FkbM family methyltransferase